MATFHRVETDAGIMISDKDWEVIVHNDGTTTFNARFLNQWQEVHLTNDPDKSSGLFFQVKRKDH